MSWGGAETPFVSSKISLTPSSWTGLQQELLPGIVGVLDYSRFPRGWLVTHGTASRIPVFQA